MTTRHAYPKTSLILDYLRGSAGFVFLGVALAFPMHPAMLALFALAAALLLSFGLRTVVRQMSRVAVGPETIAIEGPLPRAIRWSDLKQLRLRYFSTRRDRKHGWMELQLRGSNTKLAIESQIEGFETIVERAARAAGGLPIDEASLVNLAALGIAPPKRPG